MQYVALEKLINLYDGYRQIFIVQGKQVLLIQDNGRRHLIQANCPHSDWPLQNGWIDGDSITCSKHGWAFSLYSGRGVNERALGCNLQCYKICYDQNTIGMLVE